MYTILVILIILASVLMCLAVLIQESKGGGLAADYASGNTLLGAPKTTNLLQKVTWTLAIVIALFSAISTIWLPTPQSASTVLQMEQPAQAAPVLPTIPATEAAETATPSTLPTEGVPAN